MVKSSFWSDTFEEGFEFAQSTAKQSVQSMKQTFSPLKILEQAIHGPQFPQKPQLEKDQSKRQDHTPLNLEDLRKKYQDQDKQKMERLRNRLFQLVKTGEEKASADEKKKEEERKRKILLEEQEKKKKEEKKRKQEAEAPAPLGKIRRSIFSPKKVAQRQQAEVKPATGKQ